MPDPTDMLTAIEEAVLARLVEKIPVIKAAGVQKDARQQLRDIACAVAVLDGSFGRLGQAAWRNTCTVSVLLKFKNMQSEADRRKGINPLTTAAIQYLAGQQLGLGIGPLVPVRFRDATTEEKYQAGVIEYLLEFSTWFDIRRFEEEELLDLVTLSVEYLLKPGDDIPDASDTITTTV